MSGDLDLTFSLDLFNVLNDATVTARDVTFNEPTARWVQGVLSPRI